MIRQLERLHFSLGVFEYSKNSLATLADYQAAPASRSSPKRGYYRHTRTGSLQTVPMAGANPLTMIRFAAISLLLLFLSGCASMKPAEFAGGQPVLQVDEFFHGRTRSTGVVENRGGVPMQRVETATVGRRVGDVLEVEQELRFAKPSAPESEGKVQRRSWQLRRVDANHYTATANDIVGTARGEAYGNVFHWEFTLATQPGNPLANVRMSQWMYLQPDGRTLLNHSTIRKAGVIIAQVTEQFRHEGQ